MINKNEVNPIQAYRQALAKGRFIIQQCRDCGKYFFPADTSCPYCAATDFSWREPSGNGVVLARSQETEVERLSNIVAVELEEGPLIKAPLLDVEATKISADMLVSLHIALVDGNRAVVFYNKEQGSKEW